MDETRPVKMVQQKIYVCSLADCGKPGLARCSQCKVRYCGEECQADDWPAHMRFCLPLPPLEYPDTKDEDEDLLDKSCPIIDVSDSTISAGGEQTQPAQEVVGPGDQLPALTKVDGETDGEVKKEEEMNNNLPGCVEKLAKVPGEVQPTPEVGAGSVKPEEPMVLRDSSSVQEQKVKAATSSTQMATQEVSAGLQDIDLLAAVQIVSPAEFSISLAAEVNPSA